MNERRNMSFSLTLPFATTLPAGNPDTTQSLSPSYGPPIPPNYEINAYQQQPYRSGYANPGRFAAPPATLGRSKWWIIATIILVLIILAIVGIIVFSVIR